MDKIMLDEECSVVLDKKFIGADRSFQISYADEICRSQYYLYEYSDKVQLITRSPQYPTLFNYVKTGILTENEMVEAITYR